MLEWAAANGCELDYRACSLAAAKGKLFALQTLKLKLNVEWNEWTCAKAAENGHIAVLQWARSMGCPWDRWSTTLASFNKHVNVLEWAKENGCPYDEAVCRNYARKQASIEDDVIQIISTENRSIRRMRMMKRAA